MNAAQFTLLIVIAVIANLSSWLAMGAISVMYMSASMPVLIAVHMGFFLAGGYVSSWLCRYDLFDVDSFRDRHWSLRLFYGFIVGLLSVLLDALSIAIGTGGYVTCFLMLPMLLSYLMHGFGLARKDRAFERPLWKVVFDYVARCCCAVFALCTMYCMFLVCWLAHSPWIMLCFALNGVLIHCMTSAQIVEHSPDYFGNTNVVGNRLLHTPLTLLSHYLDFVFKGAFLRSTFFDFLFKAQCGHIRRQWSTALQEMSHPRLRCGALDVLWPDGQILPSNVNSWRDRLFTSTIEDVGAFVNSVITDSQNSMWFSIPGLRFLVAHEQKFSDQEYRSILIKLGFDVGYSHSYQSGIEDQMAYLLYRLYCKLDERYREDQSIDKTLHFDFFCLLIDLVPFIPNNMPARPFFNTLSQLCAVMDDKAVTPGKKKMALLYLMLEQKDSARLKRLGGTVNDCFEAKDAEEKVGFLPLKNVVQYLKLPRILFARNRGEILEARFGTLSSRPMDQFCNRIAGSKYWVLIRQAVTLMEISKEMEISKDKKEISGDENKKAIRPLSSDDVVVNIISFLAPKTITCAQLYKDAKDAYKFKLEKRI